MLGEAGIHTFFNGPESFTPDDAYHLGLAPEMDNVWVAAGFNSIGIQSAGGAGMALSQWMDAGAKPFDLGDVDISRMQPFQGNKHYLFERSKETLGLLYADHFPYRQKATARGVRRTPFHQQFKAQGAVFGEIAGWERANWYATDGQSKEYSYSWKRQNWFDNAVKNTVPSGQCRDVRHVSFGNCGWRGAMQSVSSTVSRRDMSVPVGKSSIPNFQPTWRD